VRKGLSAFHSPLVAVIANNQQRVTVGCDDDKIPQIPLVPQSLEGTPVVCVPADAFNHRLIGPADPIDRWDPVALRKRSRTHRPEINEEFVPVLRNLATA